MFINLKEYKSNNRWLTDRRQSCSKNVTKIKIVNIFFTNLYPLWLYYSPQKNRLGVFVSQRGPLHKEAVRQPIQDLSCQRQWVHSANAFDVHNQHFLHSHDAEEESCRTKWNASPRAVTQHLKQQKHRDRRGWKGFFLHSYPTTTHNKRRTDILKMKSAFYL